MYCVQQSSTRKSAFFFFFNDTATTEIYTLSLHDALPISALAGHGFEPGISDDSQRWRRDGGGDGGGGGRSEEHTSELQSQSKLVCRLLLEKKKKIMYQSWAMISHSICCTAQCSLSHRHVY